MDPVMNLLTFYTMERNLFTHLVTRMSIQPSLAKSCIALWLWLEFIGHHDLVQRILSQRDVRMIRAIIAEGQSCLAMLRSDSRQPLDSNDIPLTAALIKEPISLRFFHYNRDVATPGISHFLHNVCDLIFSDAATRIMEQGGIDQAVVVRRSGVIPVATHSSLSLDIATTNIVCHDELGLRESTLTSIERLTSITGESSSQSTTIHPPVASQSNSHHLISRLNPMAEPWSPNLARNSEDHRSMFLTFSRGYPLRREEVLRFFTSRWGNCVQTLSIERTQNDSQPMYGRVVFSNASVIPLILNGNTTAKFVVNEIHCQYP
ncbi:hypothetical protein H6P81_005853 [Aristolochia fimbriata]|uniref:Uncharacterized protein n=1 Tax=Aristolochia fimbriata TaxID=158543 RepID=A0AAV7EX24_ARIFI|nr:hypothetical protein H6P81_005853 [Aristolochia fimbriata]